MRIAEISAFDVYSVGKIMNDIKNGLIKKGIDCQIFYARGKKSDNIRIANRLSVYCNAFLARLFDNDGFCLKNITHNLIRKLNEFNPDIIHLHCIHGYYFNSKLFFKYLQKHPNIKVVWTMHDNWAITGHCAYSDLKCCKKWLSGCIKCPCKNEYPKSYFDFSKRNFLAKRKIFTLLPPEQLIIVSPSEWLDRMISNSFLHKYKHCVINNGINETLFKNMNLKREKILLGVASVWDNRKNLRRILELSYNLNEWKVVIVGKVGKLRKEQYNNVSFIERTTDTNELIEIYNKSYVLINPTLADNFPTVNIEAQLCGLNVLTYDSGGAKETDMGCLSIFDSKTLVDDAYLDSIIFKNTNFIEKDFSKKRMVDDYIRLFNII